jgi:hypothetical protein
MKINFVMLVFAILIAALLSYGFILIPGFFIGSGDYKIIFGINVFINFSLCLALSLAITTEFKRSTFLIRIVGLSLFLLSILLFLLVKLLVFSTGLIIVFSGLFFLLTLLIAFSLKKSKV